MSIYTLTEFEDGVPADNYNGLPKDGDEITAEVVNSGPVQNRIDLLTIDTEIGDVNTLVDTSASTYDMSIDNDLTNPNADLISAISQLRIDVGKKSELLTNNKTSLVGAINEIKQNLYKPSNALNLVAEYDFNINGSYIVNGAITSFVEQVQYTNLPPYNLRVLSMPYEVQEVGDVVVVDSSTMYDKFAITEGQVNIEGYENIFSNTLSLYIQDTLADDTLNHPLKFENDMGLSYYYTATNVYYRISYLGEYLEGLKSINSLTGLRPTKTNFSFDTTNTVNNVTPIADDLINYIKNTSGEDNLDFASIKLNKIPLSFNVNGTDYPCEISSNAQGIHWTTNVPPSSSSIIVNAGELEYFGTFDSVRLDSTSPNYCGIYINSTKDNIIIPNNINFINTDSSHNYTTIYCDIYRVLPRYDRLYIKTSHTDFSAMKWDATTNYLISDRVQYNGFIYSALTNNINSEPDINPSDWKNLGAYSQGVIIQPKFIYIKGKLVDNTPTVPVLNDDRALLLCTIYKEYGKDPIVQNEKINAYSMEKIKDLETNINNNIYNLARIQSTMDLSLADNSLSRNMYTEPFINANSRDIALELAHSNEATSASISNGILTNSITWQSYTFNYTEDLSGSNDFVTNYAIQLDSTEYSTIIEQPKYTSSILINKYQISNTPKIQLQVTPQTYTWVAEEKNNLIINRSTTTRNTTSWWRWGWRTWGSQNIETSESVKYSSTYTKINEPTPVPTYNITVKAPDYSFNGNEQIQIKVGDLPVIYSANTVNHLYANTNGGLNVTFPLSGLISGTETISVQGIGLNSDGSDLISGASGSTSISQIPYLKTNTTYKTINTIITNTMIFWGHNGDGGGEGGNDPVSQTFYSDTEEYLDSVYIMIDAIDNSIPIEDTDKYTNQYIFPDGKLPEDIGIQIVETTAGIPDYTKILARGILPKGTVINQGSDSITPEYSKVELYPKIKLQKGKYYSCTITAPYETYQRKYYDGSNYVDVFSTPSGTRLKIRVAELAKRYPNPGTKANILNTQAYNDGVLLVSSNNMTWTPVQTQDLTFKLTSAVFNPNKTVNKLVNVAVNSGSNTITDIIFEQDEKLENNSKITNYITINGDSTIQRYIENGSHIIIPKNTVTDISLDCYLKSTDFINSSYTKSTPSISRSTNLHLGTVNKESVYVSQNIKLNNTNTPITGTLTLYADTIGVFNTTKCKIYYTTDAIISDTSWIEMTYDSGYSGPNNEVKYTASNVTVQDNFRYKIVLTIDLSTESSDQRTGIDNIRIFI